jgi:DNA-binding PadR family transcriptional regulator
MRRTSQVLTRYFLSSMMLAMPTPRAHQRSSLGLMVLWQLYQEPSHVYGMQRMFEAQGKDRVVNVRSRASLYQAIDRLVRLGFVEVVETVHRQGYSDRVVYGITDSGRQVAREWLREMLSSTEGECPDFIAAVSVLFGLEPDDARAQLELRVERLAGRLAEAEREFAGAPAGLPRLFVLEEEYRITMLKAELEWLRGVIEDLGAGRLTWSEQWLRELADKFLPQNTESEE